MRLPRIFTSQVLSVGAEVLLSKEAVHYVQQVLRLRSGATVVLFNGQGGEYRGVLRQNHKALLVFIEEFIERTVESNVRIHLGQGISRGEKMDYVVQKAVELGVCEITPLFTERCGVRLVEDRAQKRLDHWQKIVHSACEQSGRNKIPRINPPSDLSEWLESRTEECRLLCHPSLTQDKGSIIIKPREIVLLVGAEGGFADAEVNSAIKHQFVPFSLGPRILRTETAAVAALTKIQTCWGDL